MSGIAQRLSVTRMGVPDLDQDDDFSEPTLQVDRTGVPVGGGIWVDLFCPDCEQRGLACWPFHHGRDDEARVVCLGCGRTDVVFLSSPAAAAEVN